MMKKNVAFALTRTFLIILFVAFTLSSIVSAEEGADHLQPCFNPMMGSGPPSEYFVTLNKMIFSERPLAMVSMMTLPSFDIESVVMVYPHGEGEAVVEYIRPVKQIWAILRQNDDSKVDRSIRFTPVETIKLKSYTRSISMKTAETLTETWRYMIERARIDSLDDMMILDGTRYYFAYMGVLCGSHYSTNVGATVDELMGLAEALEHYAKSEEGIDITEESILNRAQGLLKKLKKK